MAKKLLFYRRRELGCYVAIISLFFFPILVYVWIRPVQLAIAPHRSITIQPTQIQKTVCYGNEYDYDCYEIRYAYSVDDHLYEGVEKVVDRPQNLTVNIIYNVAAPSISGIEIDWTAPILLTILYLFVIGMPFPPLRYLFRYRTIAEEL